MWRSSLALREWQMGRAPLASHFGQQLALIVLFFSNLVFGVLSFLQTRDRASLGPREMLPLLGSGPLGASVRLSLRS